jgi:hypothetical protein
LFGQSLAVCAIEILGKVEAATLDAPATKRVRLVFILKLHVY